MTKNQKRTLALMLAATMAGGLGVTGNVSAAEMDPTAKAAEAYAASFNADTWTDESAAIYDATLSEFYSIYQSASEAETLSERFALQAVAEAKMLETGVMLPLTTRGGAYGIGRVAPYSINTTLWGNDADRLHSAIVTTEPIVPADRDEMKEKWKELRGTGTYKEWAKEYLTGNGYEPYDNLN